MAQLNRETISQGRTTSDLVESALRRSFKASRTQETLPPLPSFDSGGALGDIADRGNLYEAMKGRR